MVKLDYALSSSWNERDVQVAEPFEVDRPFGGTVPDQWELRHDVVRGVPRGAVAAAPRADPDGRAGLTVRTVGG
jgi:hypothetical protein